MPLNVRYRIPAGKNQPGSCVRLRCKGKAHVGQRFWGLNGQPPTMNRNTLYLVIGALAVVALVVGYLLYQERQKTTGIDINVGERGISIETK